MKKRFLALVLGGAMTCGIFLNTPVTVQAVKFEECDGESTSHIKSASVATVDGKLTVTVSLDFETENGGFYLTVLERKLEKVKRGDFVFYDLDEVYNENATEPLFEQKSGTYTFDELPGDKTYYVYCEVADNHEVNGWGENGDEEEVFLHYAAYLGTNAPEAVSSGNSSSESISSGSSEPAWSDYEDKVTGQIKAAEAGSTVVMNEGVNTLSGAMMRQLLEKGDVSLRMEFTYDGKDYVIIIPAGEALDSDIPWYGPLYLAAHYGNSLDNAAPAAENIYEVKSGDSLSKIASRCNMTLKELLAKNPQIKDPNKIRTGQKINR